MVIIEKDGIRYEATEIEERIQKDTEAEIILKNLEIEEVVFEDTSTLEILLEYWLISQNILDIIIKSNEIKTQQLEVLKGELSLLDFELNQ